MRVVRFYCAVIVALVLVACGSEEVQRNPAGATPSATLSDNTCGPFTRGAVGVLNAFCDGTASIKLTLAGEQHVLRGGSCSISKTLYTLNAGALLSPSDTRPPPDYVGMVSQVQDGPFTNAVLSTNLGGRSYALLQNTGEVSTAGGTFAGMATVEGGEPVQITGSFTCQ